MPPGWRAGLWRGHAAGQLVTHVRGYAQTGNDFLFERRLNDYLPGIVAEFSKGKPTLIFCRFPLLKQRVFADFSIQISTLRWVQERIITLVRKNIKHSHYNCDLLGCQPCQLRTFIVMRLLGKPYSSPVCYSECVLLREEAQPFNLKHGCSTSFPADSTY